MPARQLVSSAAASLAGTARTPSATSSPHLWHQQHLRTAVRVGVARQLLVVRCCQVVLARISAERLAAVAQLQAGAASAVRRGGRERLHLQTAGAAAAT